ncbi:hypothetical protein ES319_A07G157100v1 [Gossypium barbadense]|uniref:Uncharacterized protein n=1 Tax=Gossypium barbadense TaxID=3634 RepID=A0A5J5V4I2_GOSBA|nr:hypothetical protein ES319_A07G157100v1 [Gossypium barbadense]
MDTYNGIFLRHQKVHFKKLHFRNVISNCCFSFKLTSETLVWEGDVAFLAFSAAFFLQNSSSYKK